MDLPAGKLIPMCVRSGEVETDSEGLVLLDQLVAHLAAACWLVLMQDLRVTVVEARSKTKHHAFPIPNPCQKRIIQKNKTKRLVSPCD